MKDETYSTNVIEYEPKGISPDISTKIGSGITALLITTSLITCTYAITHPDYENAENSKIERVTKKPLNWFALDRDKQFVSGILIMEAGILNHVYLKGENKKTKVDFYIKIW